MVEGTMTHRTATDQEKIAAIRAAMPVTTRVAYLNTGTNGPLPQPSHDALIAKANQELQEGRIGMSGFMQMMQTVTETRAALARLLSCDPSEVALTHNTTEGMNIAISGLNWQPGDEVISATTEHPGGLNPLYLLHQRYGVRLRITQIALQDRDPIEELRRALTPRTKAVVLSHVSWATGMILPMRGISDLAHSVGALVICDAAQGCGMVPAPVYELGVDAYACSGQKWLCGPDGTGGLFIRRDRFTDFQQTYMGYAGVQSGMSNTEGFYVPPPSAARYEAATIYPPSLLGFKTSLEWIANEVGWEWVYRRIATLGQYCYDAISHLPDVTLHTPRDRMAGLVHFTLPDIAPADLSATLAERGILIRNTPNPLANRVATGFYNTEEEIDRLVEAIAEIRRA